MANLNVRMDDEVKRQFDAFCAQVGMKTVLREQRIPFSISTDPFWNETNQDILRRSIAQLDAGMGTRHDLMEDGPDA